MSKFSYPSTKRKPHTDTYGQSQIEDPYRWLEEPNNQEVKEWVEAQSGFTKSYLEKCNYRTQIRERMLEMYNYPKYSTPFKRGNRFYFYKNDGLQNQSVLYSQDSLTGEPKVFVDPNTFSSDGTAALGVTSFSESGRYFSFGVSKSGSDWQTIEIKSIEDEDEKPRIYNEKLEWIKFSSIAWTHDDLGFFYCRYPEPATLNAQKDQSKGTEVDTVKHQKVYYHRLGTDQSTDILVYETPDEPEWLFGVEVTDDGKYLLISIYKDCDPVNQLYYTELDKVDLSKLDGRIPLVKLVDNFEAAYDYITNEGTRFYFKTNSSAPRYKAVTIDLNEKEWKDFIPQSDNVLSDVFCVNQNVLVVSYMKDVVDVIELYSITGSHQRSIPLPIGSIASLSGRKQDKMFFFKFTSFLEPGTIWLYDFGIHEEDKRLSIFRSITIKGFDPSPFHTKQVFYKSKDGTRIPMFIVSKKDIQLDGKNPVLLYGYGGFSISIQPYFSVFRILWIQKFGGVFAVANLRGGGEYGEEWHKAGIKDKKQNVFDDFIAAAEYLVENKYTEPSRLTIQGGSNGGLLVGACINQRPELFGCAIAEVGVLDMLRFHKFTIGYAWCSDYGCSDNPDDFAYLIKYSPLHTVKKGKPYPAVLLATADHDDRVSPLHSFKYISALQNEIGSEPYQTNPLLIRIELKAGHGFGMPTTKIIEEQADIYAFIAHNLGLRWID